MDKEKRPHVRQVQGDEHAVFLELFHGTLIVRNRVAEASCPVALLHLASLILGTQHVFGQRGSEH